MKKKPIGVKGIGIIAGLFIWIAGVFIMMAGIMGHSILVSFLGLAEVLGGYGLMIYNLYE
jgi:hypothetical protein